MTLLYILGFCYLDFQWRDRNSQTSLKISKFVFGRLTKGVWVWDDMEASK